MDRIVCFEILGIPFLTVAPDCLSLSLPSLIHSKLLLYKVSFFKVTCVMSRVIELFSNPGTIMDTVLHHGSCHCGAIQFQVQAPKVINAIDCNCSICSKKSNLHFIVPESHFTLLQGEDKISTYTFNTKTAKHMFCSICGVQAFYRPRSNPDGWGVNPKCLDPATVQEINITTFDGQNWEDKIEQSGIRQLSKEKSI